ncbi:MAG: cytochrome c-type biogenesis CcmF C-terminal domain-containing protein [Acidobacteriota bacterium]
MTDHGVPFSPIALVGTLSLLAAYAVAAWCVAAGIAGNAIKSRRLVSSSVYGLYGFGALIGLCASLMIYAFVTHDFAIKYVAETSDTTMSTAYKITSFWGGLDGSLLLWVLVLALFSTVAILFNHRRHRDMIGYVVGTIMVVQVFFLSLLIFTKNPFATFLTDAPIDGKGLNPALQNYWMVIHPPSLYTGFVSATIPFAFAIGALASGRLDDMWIKSIRVWVLICFGFLSLGLILGGRWAYEMLGWGGYWAWDPVENAGFIPWFTATAFLHSSIIQEQRGMMKTWNVVLVVITFFFTIFGTFMTRSGVVQSVHAFGEDNVLALQFIVFLACILVVSIGLIVYRAPKLASKLEFDSFYSREFSFLLNNWILLACAFFVLFATMFPTISEALDGTRVSVGPEFFNKWMTPLGLSLLFLAGAAPLLAWRKTTRERLWNQFAFPLGLGAVTILVCLVAFPQTKHLSAIFNSKIRLPVALVNFGLIAFVFGSIGQEYWRGIRVREKQTGSDPFTSLVGLVLAKRRKYGGYIVHLGVAVLFFGFAGKAWEQNADSTIAKPAPYQVLDGKMWWFGQEIPVKYVPSSFGKLGDYYFTYENLIHTSDDHKDAFTAQIGIYEDTLDPESRIATVYPAKWDYHKADGNLISQVSIKPRLRMGPGDVYIVLTGYDLDANTVNIRVYMNPLVDWVWIGFMILAFGTLVCLIPQGVVDKMQWKPKTRLGRAADIGILLAIVFGVMAGFASQAHAAAPTGGEHVPAGMGMGNAGGGWAAKNRPDTETAKKAMAELLCPCGCPRLSLLDCDCQTASDLRRKVLDLLAGADLSTADKRDAAYDAVLAAFVKEYGGEQVLATPKSNVTWLLPVLAAVGGLGLLLVVGRRWMKSNHAVSAGSPGASTPAVPPEDDEYADKLDDELSNTD